MKKKKRKEGDWSGGERRNKWDRDKEGKRKTEKENKILSKYKSTIAML